MQQRLKYRLAMRDRPTGGSDGGGSDTQRTDPEMDPYKGEIYDPFAEDDG